MNSSSDATLAKKVRAYSVHVYTALGVVFAFLATVEVASAAPDARLVFLWLAVAGVIDATDGPLARRWDVKKYAWRIDGRTIDDILDYLTFAFIPLLLVWKMEWVVEPTGLWVVPAMLASLLGFANTGAKQEEQGFFLGFPSYWNIVAYYLGLWVALYGTAGAYLATGALVLLTALTLLPVRFVYPNLAPAPWRGVVLGGSVAWLLLLFAMLPFYPDVPGWLMWGSLIYPAFYVGLSVVLDVRERQGG